MVQLSNILWPCMIGGSFVLSRIICVYVASSTMLLHSRYVVY